MAMSFASTKSLLQSFSPVSFPSIKSASFTNSQFPSTLTVCYPSSIHASSLITTSTITTSPLVMRAYASDFAATIGETLGDVTIFTATGQPVFIKDLWDQNQGMAVVALLRHFGCPCCWELASALKESKSKFESAGVKLIAIGVGAPNKARILAERLPFPMDCLYVDPDRKAYDVLGLYYGFGRTFFNPASAKVFSRFDSLRKAVKNYTVEATPDDRSSVLQQLPFPMDCLYADLGRKAYDALGLYYGIGRTFFNPATAKMFLRFGALQKAVRNYTIKASPDDRSGIRQQGGMFVFKGKQLVYARKDEGSGDHASLNEVFDICCDVLTT